MDRGVQRRLMVLTFNRTIPVEERIEGIGQRITTEEADLCWLGSLKAQRGFCNSAASDPPPANRRW
jgi:hypothetical protein